MENTTSHSISVRLCDAASDLPKPRFSIESDLDIEDTIDDRWLVSYSDMLVILIVIYMVFNQFKARPENSNPIVSNLIKQVEDLESERAELVIENRRLNEMLGLGEGSYNNPHLRWVSKPLN